MDVAYIQYRETRIAENRKRRLRIVRNRRIALGLIIAVIVFTTSFIAAVLMSRASTDDVSVKYYTQITVQRGDTLSGLAARYMSDDFNSTSSYINEVRSINHMSEDEELIAGTSVVVPYYTYLSED